MRSKPKPDDKAQSKRFLETARKVGADRETSAEADALIGKLAMQPPERRKLTHK
jgi:hypothetical protein